MLQGDFPYPGNLRLVDPTYRTALYCEVVGHHGYVPDGDPIINLPIAGDSSISGNELLGAYLTALHANFNERSLLDQKIKPLPCSQFPPVMLLLDSFFPAHLLDFTPEARELLYFLLHPLTHSALRFFVSTWPQHEASRLA